MTAVDVAAGGHPLVGAAAQATEPERAAGLEDVVMGAEVLEAEHGGGPSGVPRDDVVQLAAAGGVGAAGTDAGAVPQPDELGELRGWPVAGASVVEDGAGEWVGDDPSPRPAECRGPGDGGGDGPVALEGGYLGGFAVEEGEHGVLVGQRGELRAGAAGGLRAGVFGRLRCR